MNIIYFYQLGKLWLFAGLKTQYTAVRWNNKSTYLNRLIDLFAITNIFKTDAILLINIVLLKLKKTNRNTNIINLFCFLFSPTLEHYYTVQIGTDRYRHVVTCLLEEKS